MDKESNNDITFINFNKDFKELFKDANSQCILCKSIGIRKIYEFLNNNTIWINDSRYIKLKKTILIKSFQLIDEIIDDHYTDPDIFNKKKECNKVIINIIKKICNNVYCIEKKCQNKVVFNKKCLVHYTQKLKIINASVLYLNRKLYPDLTNIIFSFL